MLKSKASTFDEFLESTKPNKSSSRGVELLLEEENKSSASLITTGLVVCFFVFLDISLSSALSLKKLKKMD